MLKAKELEELIDANKDMTEDDILEMYQHFKLLTGGSEVLSKESVLKQMEERNIESISKKMIEHVWTHVIKKDLSFAEFLTVKATKVSPLELLFQNNMEEQDFITFVTSLEDTELLPSEIKAKAEWAFQQMDPDSTGSISLQRIINRGQ